MAAVRTWLTRNKIFFETLSATLLAAMAFTVSFIANDISADSNAIARLQTKLAERQTELAELQTTIALQQVLPQFVITAEQTLNGDKTASMDHIIIRNVGGVVRELVCDHAVFLGVQLYPARATPGPAIQTNVPLIGYYSATIHSPDGDEMELEIRGGEENNSRAGRLVMEFGDLTAARGMNGHLEIRRYLRLRYRDAIGEEHEEHFFVPLIFGARQLSAEEGRDVFAEHDAAFDTTSYLEFELIDAEDVLAAVTP